MKKIISLLSAGLLLFSCLFISSCGKAEDALYVYNWGEYIADGSFDTFDCIKGFEEYYQDLTGRKVKIYYTTYPSNEDMYAKILGGSSNYDVIVPSDYMIQRMLAEDLLIPVNIESVCKEYGAECFYERIGPEFRGLYYDPTDSYSVPYTYGRVGIIYNTDMVDEADCGDWDIMWNEKYKGKILQFNNARDAFATAQYMLGQNVNSSDPDDWRAAHKLLLEQKAIVQSYVMDEIYNKLEAGEAAIGAYYAGDYFTMLEVNEKLAFYYPENTNLFVDAMCIPKDSKNPDIAALFINYMLSDEPAIANAEYIYYASPNSAVFNDESYIEEMGEECMEVLYPEGFDFAGELERNGFRNLDPEILKLINSLWEDLKITGGMPAHIYVMAIAIAAAVVLVTLILKIRTKRRERYY